MSSRIIIILLFGFLCKSSFSTTEHIRCPRSFLLKKLLKLGLFDNNSQCRQPQYDSYNNNYDQYNSNYNNYNYQQQESDGLFNKKLFKGMFKDPFKDMKGFPDFKSFCPECPECPTYNNQNYEPPAPVYEEPKTYEKPTEYQPVEEKTEYKEEDYTQEKVEDYTKTEEYKEEEPTPEYQPPPPPQINYYPPPPMNIVYQQYYVPIPSIPFIREVPCGYCQNYNYAPTPPCNNYPAIPETKPLSYSQTSNAQTYENTENNYNSQSLEYDSNASIDTHPQIPSAAYDSGSQTDNSANYKGASNYADSGNYKGSSCNGQKPTSYNVNVDFYAY